VEGSRLDAPIGDGFDTVKFVNGIVIPHATVTLGV